MSFKVCPHCHYEWTARNELLADPSAPVIGYQVNYDDPEKGLFLFNHDAPQCGTTMAVAAGEFTDLHDGPRFKQRRDDTVCPGQCLHKDDFNPCPVECECAYVRDVLNKVRNWDKRRAG